MECINRETTTVDPLNNTTNVATNASDILAEKRRRQNHSQREQLSEVAASDSESTTASTTRPGAMHIQGWRGARDDDDDDDSEYTESRETITETTSLQHIVSSAQLFDEDEIQRHAELLLQQMLVQAAVVAELVDEEEMRQRAYEQAARDFHQQQECLATDQETVKQDGVTINNNSKHRQQRLRVIAGSLFFMAAITIAIVVVTAVILRLGGGTGEDIRQEQRGQGDDNVAAADNDPLPSPPSTAPSSMPSAASSWHQIGNSMNGTTDYGMFGDELEFSADGNTVVSTDRSWNGTHYIMQLRSYAYHNETNEWKQLGQIITQEDSFLKLCLSPNGKFLGVLSRDNSDGDSLFFRIFALREDKTKMNATTEDDTTVATFWEQIGLDIAKPPYPYQFLSSSLTDDLILAVRFYAENSDQGMVHTYQFDANQSDWVRMGQEIQMVSVWSMQLVRNKSTGTLVLAMGGSWSVRTFRYEPDTDSWIEFGVLKVLKLAVKDDEEMNPYHDQVYISLSMDGETLAVGVAEFEQDIGLLRTFSYDAATDDWIQLGKDLKDSSFSFGGSFSLSANGKVLVATTQKDDIILAGNDAYGQVRTWDFVADDQQGGGGEWIQRGAALEVGTLESYFGYKIALSADGSRLATSAVYALNEYGVAAGKVRVFEQY